MTLGPRLFRPLRALCLAALAAAVAWLVVTRSLAAYLAETAPDLALRLQELEPTALANLAEAALRTHQSGPANQTVADEQIRAWAGQALRGDPLRARPCRILGQLAENQEHIALASRLMEAAANRSIRESAAQHWLLRQSYARADFASAAREADILLRTRPQAVATLMPALGRMAEDQRGGVELKKLLARNPPWRQEFFSALPAVITDARTPLELLLSLGDTPAPATTAELRSYLNFLIGKKLYELAYYVWLQFLPPEKLTNLGLLFNGNFETAPSGLPFDWTMASGAGVTFDIVEAPGRDGKRALFIEFGYGRVEFQPVTQLLKLPPGAYRFTGSYKGEISSRRGLQWRVVCAGGPSATIGQSASAVGAASAWKAFEFGVAVPNKDCSAQYVQLSLEARSASEQLASGSIWYSDLRIEAAAQVSSRP